ncbi:MAG: YybH family protein, partial [Chromatiales bacterium]
ARLVAAINRCDIETAMTLYEPEAALVAQPGNVVTGTKALRDALAGFIALKPTITTEVRRLIQAGDVALYCSKWSLRGTDPQGKALRMEGRSTDVLRRQPGGAWLIAVDNPWGADILREATSNRERLNGQLVSCDSFKLATATPRHDSPGRGYGRRCEPRD